MEMNSNLAVIEGDWIVVTVADKGRFDQINVPEERMPPDPETGEGFIKKTVFNGKQEVTFQHWY